MSEILATEHVEFVESRQCNYLLLDPILQDPQGLNATPGGLKQWVEQKPLAGMLVTDPSGARSPKHALRVMTFGQDPALAQQSEAWAQDPNVRHASLCGWLESPQPLFAIARHLQRAVLQKNPAGKNVILRFHDPRVMNHLLTILTPAQWSVLLGPIKQWIFVDHNGKLKRLRHPGVWQRQLDLSAAQMAAIARIELINRCLEAWKREQSGVVLPDDANAILDRHLERAERYGIRDQASQIAFALQGAWTRPDFYRHPLIQNALRQLAQSQQRYITLTDTLNEADWQRLASSPEEDLEESLT
ncbi:DUF4123 domain-containing protein [Salinicola avicenniae]|uniref:DUF4123 domain-containing protein n=1 Tax=Salinicola avicenniae TaxID=2916836 RepID=UPI0020737B32|nr:MULTISPECIES: DUF4123 domain-containing protein [unclassified Salinicola]